MTPFDLLILVLVAGLCGAIGQAIAGYALFSGLVFIAVMGITLAPVAHRTLHKFHLDEGDLRE
jgi:uncharacterized membrane protein YeaQ/YmgE (transglycosylase-associated protein family)